MAEAHAPRSVTEAAELLRAAPSQGVRVTLSDRELTAVSEYEPADLVIGVQAGATLADIARATTPHNQFLPLDPPVADDASIGTIVAHALAGPLRLAHGTPRDQVLGLEVVTGDGRVLELGGRVVKNVAGYDLVRLIVGSRGTLGFITRVHLRLKPMPAVDETIVVTCDSLEGAADLVDALQHLDPVALEILSAATGWQLLARFHGNVEAVSDGITRVAALTAQHRRVGGDADWRALRQAEAASAVCVRFANLPSQLRETAAAAQDFARAGRLRNSRLAIHAGNGIVRVLADDAGAQAASAAADGRARMLERGGSMIAQRLPGATLEEPADAITRALMQRIKTVFDPAGTLG